MPWLRRLVAGVSPRRRFFDPGLVRERFVVDRVAFRQVSLPAFLFCPISIISPILHRLLLIFIYLVLFPEGQTDEDIEKKIPLKLVFTFVRKLFRVFRLKC